MLSTDPFVESGVMTTELITNTDPASSGTESATLEPVKRNLYLRLWKGVPRELGFLLLAMPIAMIGFGVATGLLNTGIATLVTVVFGVVFIAALLYVGRGFGTLELVRLQWAGRPAIARPAWPIEPGFWGWVRSLFGNGHYWLYSLHTILINSIVSLVSWTVTVIWLGLSLGGLTYWAWGRLTFLPDGDSSWFLSRLLFRVFGLSIDGIFDRWVLDSLLQFGLGLVFLATLPFVVHGFVLLHNVIARGVLGKFASEDLRVKVTDLSASREAAVSAEGHSLRRLERDIHDGPQQRLVRLQMDLAAAERQLKSDPKGAAKLIAEARQRSQEALDELRALSRGFAPPILLDRGLVAALESLASRSTLPVTVKSELDASIELPQEIERNAYFVASELVSNATKHSGASAIEVEVAMRRLPERDDRWLDVKVTDDGHGGANSVEGHGLAGLEERLLGLGGTLELNSPKGGPTIAIGHLPVTY